MLWLAILEEDLGTTKLSDAALVGVSPGTGLPAGFQQTDLSEQGTCGPRGTHTRSRTVLVLPENGGAACPALEETAVCFDPTPCPPVQDCTTVSCNVDCQMGAWGAYGTCQDCDIAQLNAADRAAALAAAAADPNAGAGGTSGAASREAYQVPPRPWEQERPSVAESRPRGAERYLDLGASQRAPD